MFWTFRKNRQDWSNKKLINWKLHNTNLVYSLHGTNLSNPCAITLDKIIWLLNNIFNKNKFSGNQNVFSLTMHNISSGENQITLSSFGKNIHLDKNQKINFGWKQIHHNSIFFLHLFIETTSRSLSMLITSG